ncbi:MAG: zinc ABC transporter substrate-binding protein, partial [Candidatus Dadabacteria bacterium]|nr:zinc ABC transporter substrate-binding protein [Candidatus Dadabacteria bacterium]
MIGITIISCSSENSADQSYDHNAGTLKIVATTGMITGIAKNVGGTHVKAEGLMGPGVDPHLYKASARDVALLSKANLVLYNGLHLEGKMSEIFEQMNKRGIKTVAVADGIDKSLLLT